jgi:hypothetical protein
MVVRSLTVAVAALLALPIAAFARRGPTIDKNPLVWSTINVCDTPGQPDTLGLRASMPGSRKRGERMFMRFQAQFYDAAEGMWHNMLEGGDSGWLDVGSARYRVRQSGWLFRFDPPPEGTTELLRGAVTFEWRRGHKVVRRTRKRTSAGHRSAAGADPKGFSAARCKLR